VFQSYALFPNLTVADNVAYGLVNRKVPRAQARGTRAELVASWWACPAARTSTRRSSRAASSSASRWRARWPPRPACCCWTSRCRRWTPSCACTCASEIRSLQRKLGVTTIMVTHDQEEALSVADRIVVMNHGVIEQVGTPMEVYRDPGHALRGRLRRPHQRAAGHRRGGAACASAATLVRLPARRGSGRAAKVYLRPEDVLARPIAPATATSSRPASRRSNSWAPYCLVRVPARRWARTALTVYLSLNFLAEHRWRWAAGCRCACCPSACACSPEAAACAMAAALALPQPPDPRSRPPRPTASRTGHRRRGAAAAGLPGRAAAGHPGAGAAGRARPLRGLANFISYAQTPALLESLWNSLWVSAVVTLVTVPRPSCSPMRSRAAACASRRCFRGITLIPLLAPSLLSAISLIYWFGNQGVLKGLAAGLGIEQIYGAPGIVMARDLRRVPARADDPGHGAHRRPTRGCTRPPTRWAPAPRASSSPSRCRAPSTG
jgi:iron(III) transport system ATP-binding protein